MVLHYKNSTIISIHNRVRKILMFRILFFMSIFLSLNTVLATPLLYDISPMNRLNTIIQQQYINCSTSEVAAKI